MFICYFAIPKNFEIISRPFGLVRTIAVITIRKNIRLDILEICFERAIGDIVLTVSFNFHVRLRSYPHVKSLP